MTRSVRALTIALPVLTLLLSVPAAQDREGAGVDAMVRRAADRMRALQQEADRIAADSRTLIGDLRKLEIERELKSEELSQITTQSQAVASQLAATHEQIDRLEREDAEQRPGLEARLVELYKLGQGGY